MQYSVPQFIDVENKIIGPISVRQFIMLAIALTLIFLFYKFADLGLFIFAAVVILFATVVLAFVRVNGRPFHFFMLNLLQSVKTPHLRVWKKEPRMGRQASHAKKKAVSEPEQINYVKIAREKEKARSRLSDLSLLVDTGGYYSRNT